MTRISKQQLIRMEPRLTDRDRHLLNTLRHLRFIKTSQAMRLYYPSDIPKHRPSMDATKRTLGRLKKYGLINHSKRYIGGIDRGSEEYVWFLTEPGIRLLDLEKGATGKRHPCIEPSATNLKHILGETEVFVRVVENCRGSSDRKIGKIDLEPDCWRTYQKHGKTVSLHPDLFVKILRGKFFDHIFIEVDLATESMRVITNKCKRYIEYYQAGKEQREFGVFPLVLWVVPSDNRKQKITDNVKKSLGSHPRVFYVVTVDELDPVLKGELDKEKLC